MVNKLLLCKFFKTNKVELRGYNLIGRVYALQA